MTADDTASSPSHASARVSAFQNLFGPAAEVVADPRAASARAGAPRVDVAIHRPGHGDRDFYTLVTHGMSDRPMNSPPELGPEVRRAELVLYVDQPGPATIGLLRSIAGLPFTAGSWLGHGHTLPNGDPPAPLFPGGQLDTVLLLDPIVAPERHARRFLQVGGDPLGLLWLFPITSAESGLKVERGLQALLDEFNRAQISFVLDPQRPSLV